MPPYGQGSYLEPGVGRVGVDHTVFGQLRAWFVAGYANPRPLGRTPGLACGQVQVNDGGAGEQAMLHDRDRPAERLHGEAQRGRPWRPRWALRMR
jgi:hypothetical protein